MDEGLRSQFYLGCEKRLFFEIDKPNAYTSFQGNPCYDVLKEALGKEFSLNTREKKLVYARQTADAAKKGVSNCPLCAIGHDANARRVWKLAEMDADHVAAWSKGGATDISNCQMLCRTHNRAKGNR